MKWGLSMKGQMKGQMGINDEPGGTDGVPPKNPGAETQAGGKL